MRFALHLFLTILTLPVLSAMEPPAEGTGRLPLELRGSKIYSTWNINGVEASVHLESGFPKIVFNETFTDKNPGLFDIEQPQKPQFIGFWDSPQRHPVKGFVKDTLTINGKKIYIDALVVDMSLRSKTAQRDVIFPVTYFDQAVELNFRDKYMRIGDVEKDKKFISYDVKTDPITQGPYFYMTLKLFGERRDQYKLEGHFLVDLGAGNAFVLNKNNPGVIEFSEAAVKLKLDETRYEPNPHTELEVLEAKRLRFADYELEGVIVPVMKLLKKQRSDFFSGVVGVRFLENFIVIFDKDKIHFKPSSQTVKIR